MIIDVGKSYITNSGDRVDITNFMNTVFFGIRNENKNYWCIDGTFPPFANKDHPSAICGEWRDDPDELI